MKNKHDEIVKQALQNRNLHWNKLKTGLSFFSIPQSLWISSQKPPFDEAHRRDIERHFSTHKTEAGPKKLSFFAWNLEESHVRGRKIYNCHQVQFLCRLINKKVTNLLFFIKTQFGGYLFVVVISLSLLEFMLGCHFRKISHSAVHSLIPNGKERKRRKSRFTLSVNLSLLPC